MESQRTLPGRIRDYRRQLNSLLVARSAGIRLTACGLGLPVVMDGKIAAKQPMEAELESGKTYFWCACGYSKTQPFCDGTHKEANATITDPANRFKPMRLSVETPQKAWLCMCKHTKNPPYCDGTHKTL